MPVSHRRPQPPFPLPIQYLESWEDHAKQGVTWHSRIAIVCVGFDRNNNPLFDVWQAMEVLKPDQPLIRSASAVSRQVIASYFDEDWIVFSELERDFLNYAKAIYAWLKTKPSEAERKLFVMLTNLFFQQGEVRYQYFRAPFELRIESMLLSRESIHQLAGIADFVHVKQAGAYDIFQQDNGILIIGKIRNS